MLWTISYVFVFKIYHFEANKFTLSDSEQGVTTRTVQIQVHTLPRVKVKLHKGFVIYSISCTTHVQMANNRNKFHTALYILP